MTNALLSRSRLRFRFRRLALHSILLAFLGLSVAKTACQNSQQLAFAGIRSVNGQGQFNAVQTDSAGNIYLLLDQKDGVRILKMDNGGLKVLAQALLGGAGDVGLGMALDPAGNVYITGTTASTTLAATAGAAIGNRTDATTNSFVAKFDGGLHPLFVSFTGGSRIVANAIAATSSAVYVTGFTYASNLPVTSHAVLQAPAYGSTQNGFVESFSADGSTLEYATYLTGATGDTSPAAIAVDSSGNAYIGGSTSASGYPTIAAVEPVMLGTSSGFLTKITPAGDGLGLSTFVPGSGIGSLGWDAKGQTLLFSGGVALGQWPVDTAASPLVPIPYQVLVRMSPDGSTVLSSVVLAPGTQSFLAPAADGSVWVDGTLTLPLFPVPALAAFGDGFALRVSAANAIDRAARFGGLPNGNPSFASIPLALSSLAVDPAGEALMAGGIQPTASSSLLATETYDLPLSPPGALSSVLRDAIPGSAACSGSLCPGYAAYLAKLNPAASGASLSFSADGAPSIVLRNLGSSQATGLQLSTTGGLAISTNCGTTLYAGSECDVLLTGSGAGSLTASAGNASSQTVAVPSFAAPSSTIVFSPREVDFGILTSTSAQATHTITVTNLGLRSQSFSSALDGAGFSPVFTQTATDCTLAGAAATYTLAPGGVCHLTLGFAASPSATDDGIARAQWLIGNRDVLLTGYSQAASLSLSAGEVDFGTQYTGGLRQPRYLYLSNNAAGAITHASLSLPASSPFSIDDECPGTLEPHSVCRVRLDYASSTVPSSDSVTLAVDQGLSVLVTGQTLKPVGLGGASVNPNLTISATTATFTNPVPVTGVSSETRTIAIGNAGAAAVALSLSLTGDFTDATNCAATLAGGASCNVVLSFAPGQPGVRNGVLAVAAGANSTPVSVSLSGTGVGILGSNNGAIAFGSTPVGQPAVLWYKISQPFATLTATATGPYGVLLAQDIGYGHGAPASNAYAGNTAGNCVSCYLGLQFLPATAGMQTGTLTLSSASGGTPYVLTLSGSGQATNGLILTPSTQNFGSIPIHSVSGVQIFSVTNSSGASVTLPSPKIVGDFNLSSAVTGGQTCGGTLADGATCFLAVEFAPGMTGLRIGTLTIGSVNASLSGYGSVDPGLSLSPAALTFSNVPGNSAVVQTVKLSNTGSAGLQIGIPAAGTSQFAASSNCGVLVPGAGCSIAVTFTPGAATVTDVLTIPVTTTLGEPAPTTANYSVALAGTYTAENAGLQILPSLAEYGPQAVGGQGLSRQFTVSNLTAKTVALNVTLPRQFVLVGSPCTTLTPNGSCIYTVVFLPLTNGDIPGTVVAQATPTDGSAPLNGVGYVEGYGIATATLTVSGAIQTGGLINFGQVPSGQTASQALTLTNSGSTPVTVRRITSQAPFFATSTCGATLSAGASCAVTVAYTAINQVAAGTSNPASATDSGSLVIESDSASSPDTLVLTGSAAAVATAVPNNATSLATFALSQGSLSFAATAVGNISVPQVVTVTNTGTRTIHITGLQTTPDFALLSSCGTLVAGTSCTINVTSTPLTTGIHASAIEIASDAATGLEFITLLGAGVPATLTITPAVLDFGVVVVGSSTVLPVQIANNSSAAIAVGAAAASGDFAVGGNCPTPGGSLAAGSACTLQVSFAPSQAGTRSGTLILSSSGSAQPLTAALTGVGGQAHLQAVVSSLAFGNVTLGANSTQALSISNTGNVPLTALALTIIGDFSVAVPCGTTTLAPGASCTIQLAFAPTAAGNRSGTLTIASNDSASPATIALAGTGVVAAGFLLTVDGGAASSVAVTSGTPASYRLGVSPTGGFSGGVALTCAPVGTIEYAACSLLPSILTLSGGSQGSVATIGTFTATGASASVRRQRGEIFLCLVVPLLCLRKRSRRWLSALSLVIVLTITSCGGGTSTASTSNLRYTPAGSYQFQVTASSTSGSPLAQTVTLNLTVR